MSFVAAHPKAQTTTNNISSDSTGYEPWNSDILKILHHIWGQILLQTPKIAGKWQNVAEATRALKQTINHRPWKMNVDPGPKTIRLTMSHFQSQETWHIKISSSISFLKAMATMVVVAENMTMAGIGPQHWHMIKVKANPLHNKDI